MKTEKIKIDEEEKKWLQELAREYKKSTGHYLFADTRKKKGDKNNVESRNKIQK